MMKNPTIKPLPEKYQKYWDGAYDFSKNIIYLGRFKTKKKMLQILNHETMHRIIYELEGEEAGEQWDNIELEEPWRPTFPSIPSPHSGEKGNNCAKCRKHTKHCAKCTSWKII